jgi:hypothetical protein
MMYTFLQNHGAGIGLPVWVPGLVILLVVWTLFWKGLALWHSARRKQGWWFVIMLALNTLGILEIIYLFLIAKIPGSELFQTKNQSSKRPNV